MSKSQVPRTEMAFIVVTKQVTKVTIVLRHVIVLCVAQTLTPFKFRFFFFFFFFFKFEVGGPRGRVVKVADFSALDHSIISPMWVRASHGARIHM